MNQKGLAFMKEIKKKMNRFLTIKQQKDPHDYCYTFLPTGDVFTFTQGGILINQFRGNAKDGSLNNIYLRIYHEHGSSSYPLLGIRSASTLSYGGNCLQYRGRAEDIEYTVTFRPVSACWFWDITLTGCGQTVDVIYGQDISVTSENNVDTNESYVSQYIGHSVFRGANCYVVC